ncbi:MAG: Uncharacterized RND family transporter, partial [uncultured Rubrobacteraceae bacterium]
EGLLRARRVRLPFQVGRAGCLGRHPHLQRHLRPRPLRASERRRLRGLELRGREGPERHVRRVRGLPGGAYGRLYGGRSGGKGPAFSGRPGGGAGGGPQDGRGPVRGLLRGLRGRTFHLQGRGEVLRDRCVQRLHRPDPQRGRGGQGEGSLRRAQHLRHGGAGRLPGPRGREQRGRQAGREVRLPLRGAYPDLRLRDAGRRRGPRGHRGGERVDLARDHLLYRRRLRHVRLRLDALDDARPRARDRLCPLCREPLQGGARRLLDGGGRGADRGDGGAFDLLLRNRGPDRAVGVALLPVHVHAFDRRVWRGRGLRLRPRGAYVPAGTSRRPRAEGEPPAHPAPERRAGLRLLEPERRGGDAASAGRDPARRRHPRGPALSRDAHEGGYPGSDGPAPEVRVSRGRRPAQGELRVRGPEPDGGRRRHGPRPADGRRPRRYEGSRREDTRRGRRRPRRERLHGWGEGRPRLRHAARRCPLGRRERGLRKGGRARRGADPAADRAEHRRRGPAATRRARGDVRLRPAGYRGAGQGRGRAAGGRGGKGRRGRDPGRGRAPRRRRGGPARSRSPRGRLRRRGRHPGGGGQLLEAPGGPRVRGVAQRGRFLRGRGPHARPGRHRAEPVHPEGLRRGRRGARRGSAGGDELPRRRALGGAEGLYREPLQEGAARGGVRDRGDVPDPALHLPLGPSSFEGRDREHPEPHRELRCRGLCLPGRQLLRPAELHASRLRGRDLTHLDVLHDLRGLDGLRGLLALPHPRGLRERRLEHGERLQGPRGDRRHHHVGRGHHHRRHRRLRVYRDHPDQGRRPRPGRRRLRGRHRYPHPPRPRHHAYPRRLELVARRTQGDLPRRRQQEGL